MILGKTDLDMQSENNDLKVAVYMITYNHEDYIVQAVESIMMQETNFKYKLFIGEDCSTDNTRAICKELKEKYPQQIELFLQNSNIGASNNARQIFKLCFESKAKYIAMLEGDDYWTDPYKLQKQVDFLEANPDYVLCFHQVNILKTDGSIVDDFITKVPENYETQETFAQLGNYIHTPSVVFRNTIKEFPYEFELSPIGDYFLYVMLSEIGKFKYLEEKMAVYRYGVGMHSTISKIKMAKANFKLFTLLLSYSNNQKINKYFLERQLGAFDKLEYLVRKEYEEGFVLNNVFFKAIKSLKQPKKFWSKLKNKLK